MVNFQDYPRDAQRVIYWRILAACDSRAPLQPIIPTQLSHTAVQGMQGPHNLLEMGIWIRLIWKHSDMRLIRIRFPCPNELNPKNI